MLAVCVARDRDRVPDDVTGEPETDRIPGAASATLVTVPAPDGVFHVPSPHQKWVPSARVPLLSRATGRLPVTPPLEVDAKLIGGTSPDAMMFHAGVPELTCVRNLFVAVALTARACTALVPLPYSTPFGVKVTAPIPPRETASEPVQPAVIDAEASNAIVGLPPSVSVTFVSFPDVRAFPLGPAAVAHVPSPRQKWLASALMPLLRLATGRLVTPLSVVAPVQIPI